MDLYTVYADIQYENWKQEERRKNPTLIRVWDGNWNLFNYVEGEFEHRFKFLRNDAGSATLQLPLDHPVALDMINPDDWPTKSMYVTYDKDGARWSGRIVNSKVHVTRSGEQYLEFSIIHDYMKLKELLVWANPFLPAEVQFPKAWFLFGPARWAVATTLLMQLIRKNTSLWMVPDDPMDVGQWFDLDMSNWNIAVKPVDFFHDSSPTMVVSSRFQYFHDCVAPILADAQLTIDVRRFLPGDPQPIGGKNLRHGCLVIDVMDKSGWRSGSAIGGDLVTGLTRAYKRISSDGMTEGYDYINRVDHPYEYTTPGWYGSVPSAPWVVFEDSPYTGMESSEFEYSPPGASQFVTGGSSMPGVNEVIKATIIGVGGFIGSAVLQSQAGAVVDALVEPLYSDVFFAFMAHKQADRISQQGWDFPYEYWVDGADKAYTISALSALRKAKEETSEKYSCKITMTDGSPYWVGERGYGDFFIGDRVAVHALGMSENKLFINQVDELEYVSSESERGWEITVGKPDFTTGLTYLAERYEAQTSALKELGVW